MKIIKTILLLFFSSIILAQVGINTVSPDLSSILDVKSTTKGVLLPRLSTTQRNSITNPANGLLIYDSIEKRIFHFDKSVNLWKKHLTDDDISIPSSTQYDIFLIAGQSNTHYGLGLDPAIDTQDVDIFQIGRGGSSDNVVIPAIEPLQHWTALANGVGFALTFAKKYKQTNPLAPNRKILLIPCGYTATYIEQWAKGQTLYNDAISRTLNALGKYPGSLLKAILWHQGEYNIAYNQNAYKTNLEKLILDMRTDLTRPNTPFILGGMVPYWVSTNTGAPFIQNIIKNTPSIVTKTAYADSSLPSVISKPDNTYDAIHFSAAGQREMGLRYYSAYSTL